MIRAFSLLGFCILLTACDGPLPFMAGGQLSGTEVEVPAIWQLEQNSAVVQLETRPDDPYSINLTYVQLDGMFYIYAGDTRTNWVQHIEVDPRIRIRIGETIYPGKALRVSDGEELAKFAGVWANLSSFQRDPLQFQEVWLYRVVAR